MPAARTRVARIRTAGRPGGDRPSEDRVFTADNAVIVLDGASHPDATSQSGGWLAEALGEELRRRLTASAGVELRQVLAEAIKATASRHGLRPGRSPSTTVAIVRWDDEQVQALVLGDGPVLALTGGGQVLQLRDDRLDEVAAAERAEMRRAGGFGFDHPEQWRNLVGAQQAQRNRAGGYWVAEAVPEAAAHARLSRWDRDNLVAVMALTDGVADGVDRYGIAPDWSAAFRLARIDPAHLVDAVHDAEDSDPRGERWYRSKRHDDKAVALVEFAEV